MEIRSTLKAHIAQAFLFSTEFTLGDSESLLENGVIDSINIIELVLFLQQTFGIEVDDADIVLENFDSIDRLTAYVERKKAA